VRSSFPHQLMMFYENDISGSSDRFCTKPVPRTSKLSDEHANLVFCIFECCAECAVVAVHIKHNVCVKSCPNQLSSICQSPFDWFFGLDATAILKVSLCLKF